MKLYVRWPNVLYTSTGFCRHFSVCVLACDTINHISPFMHFYSSPGLWELVILFSYFTDVPSQVLKFFPIFQVILPPEWPSNSTFCRFHLTLSESSYQCFLFPVPMFQVLFTCYWFTSIYLYSDRSDFSYSCLNANLVPLFGYLPDISKWFCPKETYLLYFPLKPTILTFLSNSVSLWHSSRNSNKKPRSYAKQLLYLNTLVSLFSKYI